MMRALDTAYAACLLVLGVLLVFLARLAWAWYAEGYGMHPALALAVAVASTVVTLAARPPAAIR